MPLEGVKLSVRSLFHKSCIEVEVMHSIIARINSRGKPTHTKVSKNEIPW